MFVVVYQRFARWTARQQCVTNSWTSLWLIFAKHVIPGMMNVDEPKCLMMCLQLGCNQFSARHPTKVAENCFGFLISFCTWRSWRFWQCFFGFWIAFVRLFWWFGAWRDFQAETNQQVLVISVLYRANVKVMTQFCSYLIAFGKPACHREVAPRKFDVHSRWLTVYQINNHNTSLLFSPFLRTIRESISVGSPSFYPKIWSTPCVRLITLASHFSLMPHWKTTHG